MKSSWKIAVVIFTATCLLLTLAKSFYFTIKTGGVDLRTRTVGARLLHTDQSPYFFKWSPEYPQRLLDPNAPLNRTINGNVATPALLYVSAPLASQPYSFIRIAWTVIQLILLAGTLILLFYPYREKESIFWPVIIILLGLCCSDIFLLNVERGQVYTLFTFFFAAIFFFANSGKKNHLLISGFLAGFLLFIRPFAAVLVLPFLISKNQSWLLGWLAGIFIAILFFVLPDIHLWKEYFEAMQEYSRAYKGTPTPIPPALPISFPASIEGVSNLDQAQSFNISSLFPLPYYLKQWNIQFSQLILYFLCAAVCVPVLINLKRKYKPGASADLTLLAGMLLYFLAELFTIAARNQYNSIQWLVPLSILLINVRFSSLTSCFIISGLLLMHNFPFILPWQALIAELAFLFVLYRHIMQQQVKDYNLKNILHK